MTEDRILYLIVLPIILGLVFAEFWYRKNESKNSLANLTSNLLCGLIDRLFYLFFGIIQFEAMSFISGFSILEPIKNNALNFLILFLIVDFTWYLYHRTTHHIKLLWAFHITHHQTDDFNFSLGLRVSFLQQIVRTFFWLPIALLGFDPLSILIVIFFQNFYQFFIHTEVFDFPTFTRKIFVTPKSHKLHHSNQKLNLNKNFGGVLILWDKLFRTYASPYNGDKISLKPQKDVRMLSPLNAYFLPFIQIVLNRNKEKVYILKRKNTSLRWLGNYLLIVFIIFLVPALILIFTAQNLKFNTILLTASIIIILTFFFSHLIIKRVTIQNEK